MIKIETQYDNETDQFNWSYKSEHSHTMEHLAICQSLFELIIKNDKRFKNYEDVFEEVKRTKQDLISKEDIENE